MHDQTHLKASEIIKLHLSIPKGCLRARPDFGFDWMPFLAMRRHTRTIQVLEREIENSLEKYKNLFTEVSVRVSSKDATHALSLLVVEVNYRCLRTNKILRCEVAIGESGLSKQGRLALVAGAR